VFALAISVALALTAGCGKKNLPPTEDEAAGYLRIVQTACTKYSVPQALVFAVIEVESGGNPAATGRSGSQGLMQLMPATARRYGAANPYDPAQNVDAGVHFLHDMLVRYHGNTRLALAAYNSGPGAVDAAHGVPPKSKAYVDNVMAAYARYSEPPKRS
jgi:soluble lytic murein transglycosylase-like protein